MGQKAKKDLTIDDLTMKQQLFVDKLIEHWGQKHKKDIVKEVYGEEGKEMTDASASAIGGRLTNRRINPHVVAYLDKRKAEAVAFYEKDKLRRYKKLEYYANSAAGDKQWASAINAEYRSGQLAGMYVDKRELTVSGLEGMSRVELEKKLQELSKKIDGHNAKTIEAKTIED
tara:strand:+ start:159 stop:674 length:516 start_codon:yes stop_codon:yes gene_type:complete